MINFLSLMYFCLLRQSILRDILKSRAIYHYAIAIKKGIYCYEKKIYQRDFAINARVIRDFLYIMLE